MRKVYITPCVIKMSLENAQRILAGSLSGGGTDGMSGFIDPDDESTSGGRTQQQSLWDVWQ